MQWYYMPTTWGAISGGLAMLATVLGFTAKGRWWIAPAVLSIGAGALAAYFGYRLMKEQEAYVKKAAGLMSIADDVKSVTGFLGM